MKTAAAGWRVAWLLGAVTLAGCGAPRVTIERRGDGLYHLKCGIPLPGCLNEANVCPDHSYTVVRAVDQHDRHGVDLHFVDLRHSEALVRCAPAGGKPPALTEDAAGAPPATPSAPPAPPRVCVPGASQACVGVAGCAGGQVCAAGGGGFGACDCGGPAPAPPAAP
jgi:hypothetical protein